MTFVGMMAPIVVGLIGGYLAGRALKTRVMQLPRIFSFVVTVPIMMFAYLPPGNITDDFSVTGLWIYRFA